MSAAGSDGFVTWLLAAVGGAMDAEGVSPDTAGSVRAELAKFAGAGGIQVVRPCRNSGRVDAMLAGEAGPRWAVVAGPDGQDRVTSLWVQREAAAFSGTPGGLVVVLNGRLAAASPRWPRPSSRRRTRRGSGCCLMSSFSGTCRKGTERSAGLRAHGRTGSSRCWPAWPGPATR
jgi:hypothetical protein